MRRTIARALAMGLVILIVTGCNLVGSAVRPELAELAGIWRMSDGDGADFEFFYLEISSEGRLRSWYPQGLSEELQLRRQDNGVFRAQVLKHPYLPHANGIPDYNIDSRLRGEELLTVWYPDDPDAWDPWSPTFVAANEIPEGSYELDFEDGSLGLARPHGPTESPEWEITDDAGNAVLQPVRADENSDADILIAPGENFSFEFRAKRMETPAGTSWFAFDLTSFANTEDNLSKWFSGDTDNTLTLGDRFEDNEYFAPITYSTPITWGTWHTYRVEVTDGTTIEFFFDGDSQGSAPVPYGFVEQLKIEGNPESGLWYFDDLKVRWTP